MILPMTTYFLWLDNKIIGIYHVIHELNEYQRERDGHISYAILKDYRGQGYASKGLSNALYMFSTCNGVKIEVKNLF